MNTRSRLVSLFAAAVLCSAIASPAFAVDPPPLPSWYHYSWDIPILQGEYMAINGGTLGSLSLGFTADDNHTFGGATLFYDATGNPVTQATGGQVHYNDDATVASTGVIAWTDISTYNTSDGPCRGCADHPRQQTQTSDVAKFEWTGPRAGHFTVNGQTQDMVEAISGPPLVAPTDLSGTWLVVSRTDGLSYGQTPPFTSHTENVAVVRFVPVTITRTYQTVVDPPAGIAPFGSVALPPSGSTQFDVVCATSDRQCNLNATFGDSGNLWTLWFDNSNSGRLMPVTAAGSGATASYTVADGGRERARAYVTQNRIIVRQAFFPNRPVYWISEFSFIRLGSDALKGDWRKTPCSISTPPPLDCNSGG